MVISRRFAAGDTRRLSSIRVGALSLRLLPSLTEC